MKNTENKPRRERIPLKDIPIEPIEEFDIKEELIAEAKKLGIKIKNDQAEKFQIYLRLLLEWNQRVNLTAITDPHEACIKHFIDSLTFLKSVNPKEGAKLIDVGTGAGFPGIPIKIMRPDIKLTLLDGLNKRLVFLDEVCKAIGIEAELVHKRAEEAGKIKGMRESYDIATARAVARLNTLAEYCIPLIKMKGLFVVMKGPGFEEEMEEGKRAVKILGCDFKNTDKYEIEYNGEKMERNICVMQKHRFTDKEYPRHGNTISKSPLK